MKKPTPPEVNLSKSLAKLSTIAEWFDHQQEIDVEQGLSKVKEAATLIKECRGRLKAIENEFEILKIDIEEEEDTEEEKEIEEPKEELVLPF